MKSNVTVSNIFLILQLVLLIAILLKAFDSNGVSMRKAVARSRQWRHCWQCLLLLLRLRVSDGISISRTEEIWVDNARGAPRTAASSWEAMDLLYERQSSVIAKTFRLASIYIENEVLLVHYSAQAVLSQTSENVGELMELVRAELSGDARL